jgi:lactose/L-arabinose transport system permease protein
VKYINEVTDMKQSYQDWNQGYLPAEHKSCYHKMVQYRHFYLFILPFVASFLIFLVFPFCFSFWLSFNEWSGFGSYRFIGLDNYIRVFSDHVFQKALLNTVYFWLVSCPIILGLSLLLAVALNGIGRFKGIFRTMYYMPFVTSVVVVSIVFSTFLDSEFGLINWVLTLIGLPKIPFLTSEVWSKPAIIILLVWRWTGYNSIIMLAGLQRISKELYESATIDGANQFRQFRYITIPLMKPILLFAFILSTIGSFQIFAEPYVLTNGGPANSSLSIVYYLYNLAFNQFRLGYGSALAYILFMIILIFSISELKLFGRKEE